ncbi:MobH family relaxase [Rhizobacter sp. Root1221]|uniref:MobH family relaxase n=1 Tax=Rhizobacter sp. Root1221 TaxID=1736433 RepID=UPI0009E9B1B2|nr:MobH family relaxase [Rhizobacter sp. Root1221]
MSFLSLFGLSHGSAPAAEAPRIEPRIEPSPAPAQIAPSVDPGIAAVTVEALLASHQDLLSRIKLCYGADKATFEKDLLDPIRRLASYVNVMPATADNYFCELGGLFRLGLEVGFYALQGTDGHIVSGRATISTRRQLEPRWRLATFFAGLCSELHRTLSLLVVTDERGEAWPAYLGPLTLWLVQRKSTRFFIRWMPKAAETRALGLFALPHVVSATTMQHLATGNGIVVPQLLASVAGIPLYRDQNVLVDLVKRATALVIDRNLIANANRYGRPILGAHIERYLIDAMRRLIVSHSAWLPNQERSRVWHGREGLFIVWPNAVTEIRKLLEEDELPGIPQSPQTILEILAGAGVVVPAGDQKPLWTITPPPGKAAVEAVKLASPDILLPDHGGHKPLQEPLIVPSSAQKPGAKPQGGAGEKPGPDQGDLALSEPDQAASPHGPNVVITSDGEVVDTTADQADITATNAVTGPAEPPPSGDPVFRLAAPMRLHPQVRDALAAAIDSMNGDAKHALAVTVPTGIFVPLDHFKKANVDLTVVLRALGELDMAICGKAGRPNTVQHELAGQEVMGFVLRPQFVEGLDPALFAPQS